MAGRHRRRRAWLGAWPTGRLAVLAVVALALVGVGGVTSRLASALAEVELPEPVAAPVPSVIPDPAPVVAAPGPPEPSPWPAVPADSGAGRRIVYCNSCQRVWLVEGDESVSRSSQVSGRRGVPRPGTYAVRSKSHPGGTENGLRLDHMVRFTKGRNLWIGFHAIPDGARGPIQSLRQLGQPLSHGCVRQAPADARALWEFAPVGTAVVVVA